MLLPCNVIVTRVNGMAYGAVLSEQKKKKFTEGYVILYKINTAEAKKSNT